MSQAKEWAPPTDAETGLPLAFRTPKGTTLPLMVMRQRKHKEGCRAKPCHDNAHWSTVGTNYLQVAHRLVWMREERPEWGIVTELAYEGPDWAVFRATISDESGRVLATGHKHENAAGFADYREKAETGAVGRALALCGYGTQFAPEFDEGERLADAPQPTKAKPEPKPAEPKHWEPDAARVEAARAKVLEAARAVGRVNPDYPNEVELLGELARGLQLADGLYPVFRFSLDELVLIYRGMLKLAEKPKGGKK